MKFQYSDDKYTGVKRTERGWAGHFLCSNDCLFRRNTLLEYVNNKLVVSTIGCLRNSEGDILCIGIGDSNDTYRFYETMVFEGCLDRAYGEYIEANVSKEIRITENDPWICAKKFDDFDEIYPQGVDNVANDMHENIVDEMARKLLNGEIVVSDCED